MEFDPNSNPPCYKTKEEVMHLGVFIVYSSCYSITPSKLSTQVMLLLPDIVILYWQTVWEGDHMSGIQKRTILQP